MKMIFFLSLCAVSFASHAQLTSSIVDSTTSKKDLADKLWYSGGQDATAYMTPAADDSARIISPYKVPAQITPGSNPNYLQTATTDRRVQSQAGPGSRTPDSSRIVAPVLVRVDSSSIHPGIRQTSTDRDIDHVGADGIKYRATMGNRFATLDGSIIPHVSIMQGDPVGPHTIFSCENTTVEHGGHDTLFCVAGYINNSGDGKRTINFTRDKAYINIADEGDSTSTGAQYLFTRNGINQNQTDARGYQIGYNLTNKRGKPGEVMAMNSTADSAIWINGVARGALYIDSGLMPTVMNVANTYYKIVSTRIAPGATAMVPSSISNDITIMHDGSYLISWGGSGSAMPNSLITMAVFVNGERVKNLTAQRRVSGSGDVDDMGRTCAMPLRAGDMVDLRATSNVNGDVFTSVYINLSVSK